MQALVDKKVAGEEIAASPETVAPRGQVIDLMEALKESLARGRGKGDAGRGAAGGRRAQGERPRAALRRRRTVRREETAAPKRARKK